MKLFKNINIVNNKSKNITSSSGSNNIVIDNGIISINGKKINTEEGKVSIRKGSIYVDDKKVDMPNDDLLSSANLHITINGDVNKIDCTGSVTVTGNVSGGICCNGSSTIRGDVKGGVSCGGSVKISKTLEGNIHAGGSVTVHGRKQDI